MFLSDREIRRWQEGYSLLSPFHGSSKVHERTNTSYGLSCAGYDLTLGESYKVADTDSSFHTGLDIAAPALNFFEFLATPRITIPPNGFILAGAVEYIRMPNNLLGFVMDKSSLARRGLSVFNTVLEPGWEGHLVLEIVNNLGIPVHLYPGMGIAQLCFSEVYQPELPYSMRNAGKGGKYHNQQPLQEAK